MSLELISVEQLKEEEKKFASVKLDSDRIKYDCPSDLGFKEKYQEECMDCWAYSLEDTFMFGNYESFTKMISFVMNNKISTIRINREGVSTEIIIFINGKAYSKKFIIEDKGTLVDRMNSFIEETVNKIKY